MIVRDNIVRYAQPGALPEAALEQLITKGGELDMDGAGPACPRRQAPDGIAPAGPGTRLLSN